MTRSENIKKASFDHAALLVAFEAVKDNHGCAGVDGVTIGQFEKKLSVNLARLRSELNDGTYFPLPLMKIQVAKKNGEPRGLCIPTVRDRVSQTAVLHRINPLFERQFEECSFAYRQGRSVRQAVMRIKDYYEQGYRWVVDADIDAFFDTVDHGLMLEKCRGVIADGRILELIELWLKAEVWDGTAITVLQCGLPQGSPVSPVLANLFLDELDEAMLGKGYKFIRFADDYVVLCKTRQVAQDALELSEQVLERLLLALDEKDIVSFEQGFTYLGVTFVGSMIMTPFERPKKNHRVLFYPDPLDMGAYLRDRMKDSGGIR
ncbi:MAG: reverse transcriptase domain-containing protein [Thermodesulfobacteriota bacterium]